jgi:nicotinamide-nucleotide amidase
VIRSIRDAEIIAVGSELLTAFRLDTNSLFLAGRLDDAGIELRGKTVVGDHRADLAARLRDALARVDLVITTGGLGPTEDDLTREVAAEVIGLPLDEDAAVLARLRDRFAQRGVPMPDINRRQAQVPRGATLLFNPHGTAPGLLIHTRGRLLVCLPGPARELKPMFDASLMPELLAHAAGRRLRRRVVMVTGLAESQVEERVGPLDAALQALVLPVHRTILATPGQVEIHLSATGDDVSAVDATLASAADDVARAIGRAVFSTEGEDLEVVVGRLLRRRGWRLAAAESCTGGLLLGRLTNVPGSSAWIAGGVVAYANDVKISSLGTEPALLDAHGAVSEPVARAMARGARDRLAADVGVAVTGIAGPGGGSEAKPVGTVVIAASAADDEVKTFRFAGDRAMIRSLSVAAALDMVRRRL